MNLEVKREPLALENPEAPELTKYEIRVITEENAQEVFKEMQEKGIDPVLFGLSDRGYEAKAINDKKMMNYIIELRKILEEYRKYYEENR